MKTKILLPIALVSALAMMLFCSCTISIKKMSVNDDEDIIKKTYRVDEFKGINISMSNAIIHFEESDSFSVELSADNNVHENINVDVSNGILFITCKDDDDMGITTSDDGRTVKIRGLKIASDSHEVDIYIKAPHLSYIVCNGDTGFEAERIVADSMLFVQINGAAELNIDSIVANRTELHVSGGCDADIKNINSREITLDTSGAGEIETSVSNADMTDLITSGAAEYKINFMENCNKVRIMANGAVDVTLSGQVNSVEKNINGAAEINMDDLKVNNK